MPFKLQFTKKRKKLEILLKLLAIAAIKKIIMSKIVPRQKTRYSFGNFNIKDFKYGN